jgi:hypothetical protein
MIMNETYEYVMIVKVKVSPEEAVEAYTTVTRPSSHIFYKNDSQIEVRLLISSTGRSLLYRNTCYALSGTHFC